MLLVTLLPVRFALSFLLLGAVSLSMNAAVLEDFGYRNMRVNGQLSEGGRPLLVILLDLADTARFAHPNTYYDNLVFNPFNTNASGLRSVNGFFLVNSQGRFQLHRAGAGLIGPLSLPPDELAKSRTNDVMKSGLAIAAAHRAGFDFAPFDANGDRRITGDELMLLIFDNTNQDDSGASRWANPAGTGGDFTPANSAVSFGLSVGLMTQRVSFATLCHELSHVIGTVDLYGLWNVTCHNNRYSLMSCTITNPDDMRSYHLDAWHKLQLGWIEPRIRSLADGGLESIPAAQSLAADGPVILYDPARGTSEFFLIEYRTRTSPWGIEYEDSLPSNGLGIWHVVHDGNKNLMNWENVGQSVWLEGQPALQRGEDGNLLWTSHTTTPSLAWIDGTPTTTRLHVRPFNTGDGRLTFEWWTDSERWIDFAHLGLENGSFSNPFNTVAEGVAAATFGGRLRLKTGSSREAITISKRVHLEPFNGPVTLGR